MRAVSESGNDVTDVDVAKTAQQPTAANLSAPIEVETPSELRIFERPELDTLVAAYAVKGGSVSSYRSGRVTSKEKLLFGQWLVGQHSINRWKLNEEESSNL